MTSERSYASIDEAWAAVMRDVNHVSKDDVNSHFRFNFRGIDAVMNAVGPALRTHGVSVLPTSVEILSDTTVKTKNGESRSVTIRCRYEARCEVTTERDEVLEFVSVGEAMDGGDKAVPKAMSVCFRTALLQALCLPTDDPDPDSQSYERAVEDPLVDASELVARSKELPEDLAAVLRTWLGEHEISPSNLTAARHDLWDRQLTELENTADERDHDVAAEQAK